MRMLQGLCMLGLPALVWLIVGTAPLAGDLKPPSSAHGAAAHAVLHGRITNEDGNAVEGVTITLYGGLATRFRGQETTTGPDGRYRFDSLTTGGGSAQSGTLSPLMKLTHKEWVSADGQDSWDVEAAPGATIERNFAMIRGGRIAGSLTFGAGDWSLREFDVRIVSDDNRRTTYARTDNGGKFVTEALARGDYTVQWNSPYADYPVLAKLRVVPGETAPFKVRCRFSLKAERLE